MTRHHGLDVKKGPGNIFLRSPGCVLGIHIVARMVGHAAFHEGDAVKFKSARNLRIHFEEVTIRLLHSLHVFQHHMLEMSAAHNDLNRSGEISCRQLSAGVAADSVFSYLSIFVDDIADIILHAYGDTPYVHGIKSKNKLDSFNKVKRHIEKESKYSTLRPIFDILNNPGSWYELGFKPHVGVRQRITHYEDIITFAASQNRSDEPWKAYAYICGPGGVQNPGTPSDIVQIIKSLFSSLFHWLDELYDHLTLTMKSRNVVGEETWLHEEKHNKVHITFFSLTDPTFMPDDYLYLPLCEGSDPF